MQWDQRLFNRPGASPQMLDRDEFLAEVKKRLALRAGLRCSNLRCRALTAGPTLDPSGVINIGVAAHITAASPGGPRYDPTLSRKRRRSIENGIWLCQRCAKLIDSDTILKAINNLTYIEV